MRLNCEYRQKEPWRFRPLPLHQRRAKLSRAAGHLAHTWCGWPVADRDCWLDRWETESRFARFQLASDRGPDSSAAFARNFAPIILRQSAAPMRARSPRRPARCESDYSGDWSRRFGRSLSNRDSDQRRISGAPEEVRIKFRLRWKARRQTQPRASQN